MSAPYTEYACGKNITSMPPVRSSNWADAQGIPFLLTRRLTDARMPPTRTWASLATSPSRMAGIWVSTWAVSRCATPLSGCPDTYRPSISRSSASLCLSSHSSSGTLMLNTESVRGRHCAAEQVELAHRLGLLGAQHRIDRVGVHQEQALAGVTQRVEGARLDQRLGDLLVAGRDVDLVQVVREVGELALARCGCRSASRRRWRRRCAPRPARTGCRGPPRRSSPATR